MSEKEKEKKKETQIETQKDKDVQKEKKRLLNIFKGIDENKLDFVMHQIDNLAWLNVSAKELKVKVDKYGTMVKYNNGGGQNGVRDNPDAKTLIAYQKNITAVTKQLLDLVPVKTRDKLQEFL